MKLKRSIKPSGTRLRKNNKTNTQVYAFIRISFPKIKKPFNFLQKCLRKGSIWMSQVNKHVEMGEPVDITFLDFQNGFDTVPYQRLLRKYHSQGIRGQVLLQTENWLRTRK